MVDTYFDKCTYRNFTHLGDKHMRKVDSDKSDKLVDIHEVTKIFNLSIEAVRKYKTLGLIQPCKRVGRKDLYNEKDVTRVRNLIQSYKLEGKSLKEIVEDVKVSGEAQNFEDEFVIFRDFGFLLEDGDLFQGHIGSHFVLETVNVNEDAVEFFFIFVELMELGFPMGAEFFIGFGYNG